MKPSPEPEIPQIATSGTEVRPEETAAVVPPDATPPAARTKMTKAAKTPASSPPVQSLTERLEVELLQAVQRAEFDVALDIIALLRTLSER